MSRTMRCRRCGREFVAGRFDAVSRLGRLCPACRGPLPPTGLVSFGDGLVRPREPAGVVG